jgi:hypothetical protein
VKWAGGARFLADPRRADLPSPHPSRALSAGRSSAAEPWTLLQRELSGAKARVHDSTGERQSDLDVAGRSHGSTRSAATQADEHRTSECSEQRYRDLDRSSMQGCELGRRRAQSSADVSISQRKRRCSIDETHTLKIGNSDGTDWRLSEFYGLLRRRTETPLDPRCLIDWLGFLADGIAREPSSGECKRKQARPCRLQS